ncbi:TetR/AcrR family transcriptional regulator [Kibdelosporangium phytohabitans]|uniref:TetR family transcriptional regulator n=1 Tax=Kibdelosporangium phytohabitans TaxID=860235 RepID=A0A0N9I430_9PSEU|nr:TetR/AcrR family transcriptional regulator [Kibdelosporangium phytohabitans]ALG09284.1 TetR family transcriptional regulator [Kibdelosporangium phytohabitans]MBE1469465.1 AcrR family transcriptional regulator [Kibdelosporangium phytohabitans]
MTETTRTRRRGPQLEQAILDAAWAELSDVGYPALTIEAVAKRAGTSKPVIYRRWPSRAALVVAAWATRRPISEETPDLGSLRGDLLWLFTRIAMRMDAMMSQTIAGVMSEAFKHPEVQEFLRERMDSAPLSESLWTIVDNAVARGELSPVAIPRRVLQLPLNLLRSEAIMCGTPLTEETLSSIVDDIYIPILKGLAVR